MHPAYLATQLHGMTSVVVALAFTLPIPTIVLALWWMFREPKFRGPALTGTAVVLSMMSIGEMAQNSLVPKIMCRIGLRVAVPGREPYDVKVWKTIAPWVMGAVRPGATVGVQVDSSNPRNVRIDLSGPRWYQREPQWYRAISTNMPFQPIS